MEGAAMTAGVFSNRDLRRPARGLRCRLQLRRDQGRFFFGHIDPHHTCASKPARDTTVTFGDQGGFLSVHAKQCRSTEDLGRSAQVVALARKTCGLARSEPCEALGLRRQRSGSALVCMSNSVGAATGGAAALDHLRREVVVADRRWPSAATGTLAVMRRFTVIQGVFAIACRAPTCA